MTWRQAMNEAVAILAEELGIYGQQAEAVAKDLLRLGERINSVNPRGSVRWQSNWRDR